MLGRKFQFLIQEWSLIWWVSKLEPENSNFWFTLKGPLFDPSLERSWPEFFKIIKDYDPKNTPPGCNFLGDFFFPQLEFKKENLVNVLSIYIVVLLVLTHSLWLLNICSTKSSAKSTFFFSNWPTVIVTYVLCKYVWSLSKLKVTINLTFWQDHKNPFKEWR